MIMITFSMSTFNECNTYQSFSNNSAYANATCTVPNFHSTVPTVEDAVCLACLHQSIRVYPLCGDRINHHSNGDPFVLDISDRGSVRFERVYCPILYRDII